MQHSRRICSTGNWLVAFCQRFWETYEGNANKTDLPSSGSVFRISKIGALPCKRCASTFLLELPQQEGMKNILCSI